MAKTPTPGPDEDAPAVYEVRIKGRLDARWESRFEYMTITPQANGDTLITGPVVDQAALHGILTKVRDLGMPLISIIRVDPGSGAPATGHRKDTP